MSNEELSSESASWEAGVEKAIEKLQLLGREDPEQVILYGEDVLAAFFRHENDDNTTPVNAHLRSVCMAMVLNIIGSTCIDSKSSVKYLNQSNTMLNKLLEDGVREHSRDDVSDWFLKTHVELFKTFIPDWRKEDVVHHLEKILEFKEKYMEECDVELGVGYTDVYKAYLEIPDFEEASTYCSRALRFYKECKTDEDSAAVAMVRKDLGVAYCGLGKYGAALELNLKAISALKEIVNRLGKCDSALEKNQKAISALKKIVNGLGKYDSALEEKLKAINDDLKKIVDGLGKYDQVLLMAELQNGYILTQLGKYEDAFGALKDVVKRGNERLGFDGRVLAFTAMAIALCGLQNSGEAREYMDAAREILDKEEMMPSLVVAGELGDLAVLYEQMEDLETAMYLLRRVLKTPKLPKKLLLKNYNRFSSLVNKSSREAEEFPYLEDAVEKLKGSFGLKHKEVGHANCNLADALMKRSVKYLENAKHILDASIDLDSVKTSLTLSMAYATIGRYDLAIPYQAKVMEVVKAAGPSGQENVVEAADQLLKALESLRTIWA